jgi:hypothetical protein
MSTVAPSVEEIRARLAKQKVEKVEAVAKAQATRSLPPPRPPRATISNTDDLRSFVRQTLAHREIDPIEELIDMYEETDGEGNYTMAPRDRKSLMLELLKYIAPQLKSMDINASIKSDVQVSIVRFSDQDAIPMRKAAIDV